MNTIFFLPAADSLSNIEDIKAAINFQAIPEMEADFFQADIASVDEIDSFKALFESMGIYPAVIGVWQENGLQEGFEYSAENSFPITQRPVVQKKSLDGSPFVSKYPFDFQRYWDALQDIIEYGIDGTATLVRRPTYEEASVKQVNSFAGRYPRDLSQHTNI